MRGHNLIRIYGEVLNGRARVVYDLTLVALYLNRSGHIALRVCNNVGLCFGGLNTNAHRYKKCNAEEFDMFHVEPLIKIAPAGACD